MAKRNKIIYYQGPFMRTGEFKDNTKGYYPGRPFIVKLSDKAAKALGMKK
tara:strand:- start:149 stop:298 length:150 start_codon:yes stop_codon:yes gene_type:complete